MLDIQHIEDVLPHRYPMLLVDRIVELDRGKRIVGIKNVTRNEQIFDGHYPGRPIMPGVLIIEAMAQVGGFGMLESIQRDDLVPYFAGIDRARFRKPVVPGDQLRIEIEYDKLKARVAKVSGVARVDGAIVAEAGLLFALKDSED